MREFNKPQRQFKMPQRNRGSDYEEDKPPKTPKSVRFQLSDCKTDCLSCTDCSSPDASKSYKRIMAVSVLCFVFFGAVIGISIYSAHLLVQDKLKGDRNNVEVCYPVLGCFTNREPYTCLEGLVLPTDPKTMEFTYRHYTDKSSYTPIIYDDINLNWKSGKKILIAIHGWHSRWSGWQKLTRDFAIEQDDLIFIGVDWNKEAAHPDYMKSIQETRAVARAGAVILKDAYENGIKPKDIHIVGHSMGCQMSSFISKDFKNLTGESIGRLTGLDCAGPAYENCGPAARLDKTDADYVEHIHTASGPLPALSMIDAHADADFYINDGRTQPGCPPFAQSLNAACEHDRANDIWTSSLVNERCNACPCKSYDDLLSNQCNECNGEMNTVGYYSTKVSDKPETYYLKTTASQPFCINDGTPLG